MKKLLFVLLTTVVTCGSVWAQKGMNSIGVSMPFEFLKNSFTTGVGIRYQHNFTDYYRLEIAGDYTPLDNGSEAYFTDWASNYYGAPGLHEKAHNNLQGYINSHFFLCSPRPLRPYLIVGVGVIDFVGKSTQRIAYKVENVNFYDEGDYNYKRHYCAIGVNAGVGADFRFSYHFSLQMSALAVKPIFTGNPLFAWGRGVFGFQGNIGIMYNF